MAKSMKPSHKPAVVGARVVGGTIGMVLGLAFLVFVIAIPIILIATYYYSYDLVKFLQDNKKCQTCIKGDYHCDKVLRYTPIPLIALILLNMLLSILRVNVHPGIKAVIKLISFVMYVWFISCLYTNMTHITEENCKCAAERKVTINRLRIVSKVLVALLVLSVLFSIIGLITLAFGIRV
jgi:hypothetical protein